MGDIETGDLIIHIFEKSLGLVLEVRSRYVRIMWLRKSEPDIGPNRDPWIIKHYLQKRELKSEEPKK
jgi:hypothetical protein